MKGLSSWRAGVLVLLWILVSRSQCFCFTPKSTAVVKNLKQRGKPYAYILDDTTRSGTVVVRSAGSMATLPLVPTTTTTDAIGILGGFSLLILYHVLLYRRERRGQRTWRSAQADTREQWAKYVRENQQWLYAIQTLRNAITAQTFLATTVLSLLTVISGRLWEMIRTTATGTRRRVSVAQFALVAASMLASAYQFLQSARLMTHAGFMFPVSAHTSKVDRIMRKSQNSQWAGLRCLYLSAGILSWIVGGPQVFLVASGFLTAFFRSIDQVPEALEEEEELLQVDSSSMIVK